MVCVGWMRGKLRSEELDHEHRRTNPPRPHYHSGYKLHSGSGGDLSVEVLTVRQTILLFLLNYCMVQVFLRHPIKRLAQRLAMWGEPGIEREYKPRDYQEGSWRS